MHPIIFPRDPEKKEPESGNSSEEDRRQRIREVTEYWQNLQTSTSAGNNLTKFYQVLRQCPPDSYQDCLKASKSLAKPLSLFEGSVLSVPCLQDLYEWTHCVCQSAGCLDVFHKLDRCRKLYQHSRDDWLPHCSSEFNAASAVWHSLASLAAQDITGLSSSDISRLSPSTQQLAITTLLYHHFASRSEASDS